MWEVGIGDCRIVLTGTTFSTSGYLKYLQLCVPLVKHNHIKHLQATAEMCCQFLVGRYHELTISLFSELENTVQTAGVVGNPGVYQPLNAALRGGVPEPRPGWRGAAWLGGRQPGGAGGTGSEGGTRGPASHRTRPTAARLQR
jgi:hypothetical protein